MKRTIVLLSCAVVIVMCVSVFAGVNKDGKEAVDTSGSETSITNTVSVSGSTLDVTNTVDTSGSSVDVTNTVDISGSTVDVTNVVDISGSTVDVTNIVDISGSSVDVTNIVDISGSSVDVTNIVDISGSSVDVTNVVDISNSTNIGAKLVNDSGNSVGIDLSTRTLQTIEYAHHEVHSGSHYAVCVSTNDLDDAAIMGLLIITADDSKWSHMVVNAYGALHTTFSIYEDVTNAATTQVAAYNSNRNSTNTPITQFWHSANNVTNGTLIFDTQFGIDAGGGAASKSGSGESRGDSEWVLKQDTRYLLRAASLTENNVANICVSFYEHIDKTD